MLQFSAISPKALVLLNSLTRLPFLQGFYLAGGTGLALQYGHRLSVDLDFFTPKDFSTEEMIDLLRTDHPFTILAQSKNSLTLDISGVKTDFIRHAYQLLRPLNLFDGKRIASVEDIAAMKLNVDLSNCSSGSYLVTLIRNNGTLHRLKLIRS